MDKYEAQTVINDFVKKSLAVVKWNELQNSYVYGVHDLVSDFIKYRLSKHEKQVVKKQIIFIIKSNFWFKVIEYVSS